MTKVYSYPVFRTGRILQTDKVLDDDQALGMTEVLRKNWQQYDDAFRRALDGSCRNFLTDPDEVVKQQVPETYVFTLPRIVFSVLTYRIESRNSVTVCRGKHRSKLWTRYSCLRSGRRAGCDLSALEVSSFFSTVREIADDGLDAIMKKYLEDLASSASTKIDASYYTFSFMAYNSSSENDHDMLVRLRNREISLADAANDPKFRRPTSDLFSLALGREVSSRSALAQIRRGKVDVFSYTTREAPAVFLAKSNNKRTDICGFGFDDHREHSMKLLSESSTRDLLNEYAEQF